MSYRNFFEDKPNIRPKDRMSTWIDVDLKKKLKQIGKLEEVSLNNVCRVFLDLMVEEYMNDRNKVLEDRDTPWLYE